MSSSVTPVPVKTRDFTRAKIGYAAWCKSFGGKYSITEEVDGKQVTREGTFPDFERHQDSIKNAWADVADALEAIK